MKSWEKVSLKNICLGIYDAPHATPKPSNDGAIFLGIKNITEDGKIDLSNIRYIAEDDFSRWTKRVLPKAGDIVFSYEATLNRYAIIPEGFRGCLGRRLGLIRSDTSKVNHQFLFYYFFSEDWRATISQNILFGATVNRVPVGKLPDFEILLPCLDTQNKIAAVLSTLDAKIELNNRINAELEEMAKTLYDYWFVQFDFPDENGKPYKSSGGKMVYNPTLKREIPEGWEVKELGKVCKTSLGGTPSKKNPNYWRKADIPWLNSGEISNFPIINSEDNITQEGINNSAAELLPKGSIVISIVRYIRPSILAIDATTNQSVVGIYETSTLKNSFVYPFLLNDVPRLMSLRTGAQQPHINKGVVDKILMVIPRKNILKKYYLIATPVYKKLMIVAFENQQLTQLRDWLLPMLMNGQVTVK